MAYHNLNTCQPSAYGDGPAGVSIDVTFYPAIVVMVMSSVPRRAQSDLGNEFYGAQLSSSTIRFLFSTSEL